MTEKKETSKLRTVELVGKGLLTVPREIGGGIKDVAKMMVRDFKQAGLEAEKAEQAKKRKLKKVV